MKAPAFVAPASRRREGRTAYPPEPENSGAIWLADCSFAGPENDVTDVTTSKANKSLLFAEA